MAKRPANPGDNAPVGGRDDASADGGDRAEAERGDVALVLDRTSDREGIQIVRRRGPDEPLELGTLRPLKEGKSIDGEVVSLRPRRGAPRLFDVKTELPAPRGTSGGPPQVASDDYRRGWDAIWGDAGGRGKAN